MLQKRAGVLMGMTDESLVPTSVTNTLHFEGEVGEYFRIWIVNLALSIITLGIFSAWAKVRSNRYLYGSTYLDNHAFDYHGDPLRILLGRAIALTIVLGYSFSVTFAKWTIFIWAIIFIIAIPWLVRSSLRFNARNTSYRNVRFDFHGTYGGTFKTYVLWPVLSAFTLFLTWPFVHRSRSYYNINNHSFGGKQFNAVIPVGSIYMIYISACVIFAVAIIIIGTIMVATGVAAAPQGGGTATVAAIAPALILTAVLYGLLLLFLRSFVGTLLFNLAVNNTRLEEGLQIHSSLSPAYMTWLMGSNVVAVLCSLGLLYPWARIRQARYWTSSIAMLGSINAASFTAAPLRAKSAIGEEMAGLFDFDFGL